MACSGRERLELPEQLRKITTPLKREIWTQELTDHPDKTLSALIVQGIAEGFRVGYDPDRAALQSKEGNMRSATEHAEVVSKYLAEEMKAGRITLAGTPQEAKAMGIHCSPFAKRNKPGKFRLILNLSAPENHSVNDGISRELATLSYVTVDEVIDRVLKLGRGTLMAKMDIKQAYRNVPVHPQDRALLGMLWNDLVFVDTTLPFGLRSAPLIFTAIADAAQWIMQRRGASYVFHYIDDYITMGAPESCKCEENNTIMHQVCADIGLPPEPEKDEGPTTTIVFTGIEIDSMAMKVCLPEDKLTRMRAELARWRGKKASKKRELARWRACKKRELLSLIGLLSHACKVVRAGRIFLRRLIDLSMAVKHLEHFMRLSRESRSDIEWWCQFSLKWNEVAMMRGSLVPPATVSVTSDASRGWGVGHTGHTMVYATMGGANQGMPYHYEGTGTYCGSGSSVGQGMEGPDHPSLVRQCGRGKHYQPRVITRQGGHASNKVSGIHHSEVRTSTGSLPY